MFFLSVASKGLSRSVNLLFATLTSGSISVAAKGLKSIEGRNPDKVGTVGPDRVGISALSAGRAGV